jgi:hypothetical protein
VSLLFFLKPHYASTGGPGTKFRKVTQRISREDYEIEKYEKLIESTKKFRKDIVRKAKKAVNKIFKKEERQEKQKSKFLLIKEKILDFLWKEELAALEIQKPLIKEYEAIAFINKIRADKLAREERERLRETQRELIKEAIREAKAIELNNSLTAFNDLLKTEAARREAERMAIQKKEEETIITTILLEMP